MLERRDDEVQVPSGDTGETEEGSGGAYAEVVAPDGQSQEGRDAVDLRR